MLFVGTSIIHPSTEGVFLLCNILDLLIYSYKQCLICGEVSIYEVETIEMSHKWVNGACVYCNKGYAKEIN